MGRRVGVSAALVAVAVAASAVGLAFAFPASPRHRAPTAFATSLRVGKLQVSVPRNFIVYTARGGIYRAGTRPPVAQRVLTDFRLPAHMTIGDVIGRWAALRGSGPPADKVVLELEEWWGIGAIPETLHLPLGPKQPWSRDRFANGAAKSFRWGFLRFANTDYYVLYWIGPHAPAKDRAAVRRALRSIRPAS